MPKQIQRKCKCECGNEWTDVQIYVGKKPDYGIPECPQCTKNATIHEKDGLAEIIASGRSPAVGNRAASRAGDFCGKMLEEDYGIPPSMIRDTGIRPGDTYIKPPPATAASANYIGGGGSKDITQSFLASAKASGGLGEKGNLTGYDIVQAGKQSGAISNPLKSSTFINAKD
jgi:hypothetical protein